jgi:hypothetical protein
VGCDAENAPDGCWFGRGGRELAAGCAGLKVRSCGRCDRRATFAKIRHRTGPCGMASKHAGYSPN